MAKYTDEQREQAVALANEVGPSEASRQLGIPRRTISSWRTPAQADDEKTKTARAVAAERVATQWADYRSSEAASAGASANRIRREISNRLENASGREIRDLATAYGIMIDKAEKLSDEATARIEVWAESELDRDLRALVDEMEERIRES